MICNGCVDAGTLDRKQQCPTCNVSMPKDGLIRCLAMETLIDHMTKTCEDCQTTMPYKEFMATHETCPHEIKTIQVDTRGMWLEATYVGRGQHLRLVKRETKNGRTLLYEGPRGKERLVTMEMPNRSKRVFEGERGKERHIRTKFPDGTSIA